MNPAIRCGLGLPELSQETVQKVRDVAPAWMFTSPEAAARSLAWLYRYRLFQDKAGAKSPEQGNS